MRYFVIPESLDDCEFPTMPEPVELKHVGSHIEWWLARYKAQGHYTNCNMQRIPLHELEFHLRPEFNVVEPRTTKATV
jgi:hypothetical protein